MPPRRILLVLCFIVLLISCSPSREKIVVNAAEVLKNIYDVYQLAGPALTAIAEERQPAPTLSTSDPIKEYFIFASSPGCKGIPYQGGANAPWQSTVCGQSDMAVRFDYWLTSIAMDAYLKPILEAPGTRVTRKAPWSDGAHPDETLGTLYEFIDGDGFANLIWTVTKNPLSGLSGWALRVDNDQVALYNWWAETASAHK